MTWYAQPIMSPSGKAIFEYGISAPNIKQIPQSGKIALLGSSIQSGGVDATVGSMQKINGRCAAVWIDIGSGNTFSPVVFGYSGQTTDVIRTHLTEALATKPDIVVLEYGMNNVSNAANMEADLLKLQEDAEKVILAGAIPLVWFPHVSSANGNIAGASAYNIVGQEWALYRNIPFVAALWPISNRTSTNCTAIVGALGDGLHPNSLGSRLIANEISEMLKPGGVRWRILPCGSAETTYETYLNPRCVGSIAVTEGAWITGNKPLSWVVDSNLTAGGTVVSSVGTDTEGSYWDIQFTAAALNDYVGFGETAASHWTKMLAGKTYRGYLDFEILSGTNVMLGQIFTPATNIMNFPNGAGTDYQAGTYQVGKRYRLRGYPLVRNELGTSWQTRPGARWYASGAGTFTVRVRGCSLRESRW